MKRKNLTLVKNIILYSIAVVLFFIIVYLLFNLFNLGNSSSSTMEEVSAVGNVNSNSEISYCSEGYSLCQKECYKCSEGYILNSNCQCEPDENTRYKEASAKWQQYKTILSNDNTNVNEALQDCSIAKDGVSLQRCVDTLSPRLQNYKSHVLDAQSFLEQEGDVFSNKLELSANMDNDLTQIEVLTNRLNSAINQYNAQIKAQQDQQQAVFNALKILAGLV